MSDQADAIDWTGVEEAMARQILAQGEIYLRAQLDTALASDQRATTMGSVVAAIASALLAGSIAYWDKAGSNPVLLAGIATAIVLLISAGFCMWAARPVDFYYPGNQPAHWFPVRTENLVEAIGGEAETGCVSTRIPSGRIIWLKAPASSSSYSACGTA